MADEKRDGQADAEQDGQDAVDPRGGRGGAPYRSTYSSD